MSDMLETLTSKEAFDAYWEANYVPVSYDDVKKAYDTFIEEHEGNIWLADYKEKGCISEADFMENLHEDAAFFFQDVLTEIFYDKNPDLYEDAFALYEMAEMDGHHDDIAVTFHETFNAIYVSCLMRMFADHYKIDTLN